MTYKGYIFTEEHKRKLREARNKRVMLLTKGGRVRTNEGYIYKRCIGHPKATKRGHYVLEHRLVMEYYLGRYLKGKEEVDHINGVRGDNRIENLRLFKNHSEHLFEEVKRGKYKKNEVWRNNLSESHKVAIKNRSRNVLGRLV